MTIGQILKAIACKSTLTASDIASGKYTAQAAVATHYNASGEARQFTDEREIRPTSPTAGAR